MEAYCAHSGVPSLFSAHILYGLFHMQMYLILNTCTVSEGGYTLLYLCSTQEDQGYTCGLGMI